MQVTTSAPVMQVLMLCCNYVGGAFYAVMLVDLSDAIIYMTFSVAIIHLVVSAALMQMTVSASNMWVTIVILFMQVGASAAIMQLVLSVVHIFFYCKMQVTVVFFCSYVGDSFTK